MSFQLDGYWNRELPVNDHKAWKCFVDQLQFMMNELPCFTWVGMIIMVVVVYFMGISIVLYHRIKWSVDNNEDYVDLSLFWWIILVLILIRMIFWYFLIFKMRNLNEQQPKCHCSLITWAFVGPLMIVLSLFFPYLLHLWWFPSWMDNNDENYQSFIKILNIDILDEMRYHINWILNQKFVYSFNDRKTKTSEMKIEKNGEELMDVIVSNNNDYYNQLTTLKDQELMTKTYSKVVQCMVNVFAAGDAGISLWGNNQADQDYMKSLINSILKDGDNNKNENDNNGIRREKQLNLWKFYVKLDIIFSIIFIMCQMFLYIITAIEGKNNGYSNYMYAYVAIGGTVACVIIPTLFGGYYNWYWYAKANTYLGIMDSSLLTKMKEAYDEAERKRNMRDPYGLSRREPIHRMFRRKPVEWIEATFYNKNVVNGLIQLLNDEIFFNVNNTAYLQCIIDDCICNVYGLSSMHPIPNDVVNLISQFACQKLDCDKMIDYLFKPSFF